MMGIADYLLFRANSNATAMIDGEPRFIHEELAATVSGLAIEIESACNRPGGRARILVASSFQRVAADLAAMCTGRTTVLLPVAGTPDLVTRRADLVHIQFLLVDRPQARRLSKSDLRKTIANTPMADTR